MDHNTQSQNMLEMEDNFWKAIENGAGAMLEFHAQWSSADPSLLNGPAALLAYQVAQRVSYVADELISLNFRSLSICDDILPSLPPIAPTRNAVEKNVAETSSGPTYSSAPYNWLLQNLSNPYPSRKEVQQLAQESGLTVKVITAWFSSARHKMGWTALRSSKHFKGSKTKMLESAATFFQQNGRLPDGLDMEFARIEYDANQMYAEKLTSTQLMNGLDNRVKTLDSQLKSQVKEIQEQEKLESEERTKEEHGYLRYKHFMDLKRRQEEYLQEAFPGRWSFSRSSSSSSEASSPAGSLRESSVESDGFQDLSEIETSPIIGTKRRSCDEDEDHPQRKRSRSSASPCPSFSFADSAQQSLPKSPLPTSPLPISPLPSRKRRLSDSESQGSSKRICRHITLPRLDTVSSLHPSHISYTGPTVSSSDFSLGHLEAWNVSAIPPADYTSTIRDASTLTSSLPRSSSPSPSLTDASGTDDDSDSESWAFRKSPSAPSEDNNVEQHHTTRTSYTTTPKTLLTSRKRKAEASAPSKATPTPAITIVTPDRVIPESFYPASSIDDES